MLGYVPPTNLFWIVVDVLALLNLLILVEVIVSWAIVLRVARISRYDPWVRTLTRITDPILAPFRRLLPPSRMQGLDISPLLAILVIQVLQQVLFSIGAGLR